MAPPIVREIAACRTIVHTPAITVTPRRLAIELEGLQLGMTRAFEAALHPEDYDDVINVAPGGTHVQLIVIDEAGDFTHGQLWQAFERWLIERFPDAHRIYSAQTHQVRMGITADQARRGVFVPIGRYRLHFYFSDVYLDPIEVTLTSGTHSRVDLNTLFTRVRTPAVVPDYSVTYSWRAGEVPQTLQARTKARTYYIRAGTYRLQVEAHDSTRVLTLHAPLGRVTTLPTH